MWALPPIPAIAIPSNVAAFDPSLTPEAAARMARSVVLDLIIESEARRTHDLNLAQTAAEGDGLTEFTDVIKQDVAAGQAVQKSYTFSQVTLTLFLPKFTTQASRLIGVTLTGTASLVTRDASGHVSSQSNSPYSKSWGLGSPSPDGSYELIANDYTGLNLA